MTSAALVLGKFKLKTRRANPKGALFLPISPFLTLKKVKPVTSLPRKRSHWAVKNLGSAADV
jgi:hypothetical protein